MNDELDVSSLRNIGTSLIIDWSSVQQTAVTDSS